MEAILKFSLPEENDEFKTATKAGAMASALSQIANEVFRPARKHGYGDQRIRQLVEKYEGCEEVIAALEELFHGILSENDVLDQI